MKAEAEIQAVFGTAVTPTFKLPFIGDYVDAQEDHQAEADYGFWTPVGLAAQVSTMATFTLNGTSFFEMLPIFLNAGHDEILSTGSDPYVYDDAVSVSAVGAPMGYTFLLGGNEAIGGTGPAIKIQDGYCQNMQLSFSQTARQVAITSNWFGLSINDNSGAGFAFIGSALPAAVGIMQGMRSVIEYQDATTTGGDFATMTEWDCAILAWTLNIDWGLRPKFAAEENALTFCGVRHVMPEITWQPVIRTNATTYAAVKGKADARTHQEVQLTINGDSSRQLIWQMTGRFLPNFVAHGRDSDEVVMAPTFRCETPHDQQTTPHYVSWDLDTKWSHNAAL